MNDIVKPGKEGIIPVIHGGKGVELKNPFENEIFLTEMQVAGTTHVENIKELEPSLIEGTRVSFFREPDNKYDKRAIVIKDNDGNRIGYVPKTQNDMISRLMDAGKLIYAIISSKEYSGNWLKIGIKVYLND